MALEPLKPELIIPKSPSSKPPAVGARSRSITTEEGKIAAELAAVPTPREIKQIMAAVIARAASDIILGKLQFRNAGEASKVARDFAAIAKDFDFDDEAESLLAAETVEDRKDSLAAFRKRAIEQLGNG